MKKSFKNTDNMYSSIQKIYTGNDKQQKLGNKLYYFTQSICISRSL